MFLYIVPFNVAVKSKQHLLGTLELSLASEPPWTFWEEEEDDQHASDHRPLEIISLYFWLSSPLL